MSEFIMVWVTCGSEDETVRIGRSLVEERTAACVTIIAPVRSIYRWEGKIWDEKEWLLVIKTQAGRFSDVEKSVKALHSNSVPEIVSLPILEGSLPYLRWLEEMTRG
jgi:periplasmic divalent cation tolerance protein